MSDDPNNSYFRGYSSWRPSYHFRFGGSGWQGATDRETADAGLAQGVGGAGIGIGAIAVLFLIIIGPFFELVLIARVVVPGAIPYAKPIASWSAADAVVFIMSLAALIAVNLNFYGRWLSLAITATIPVYWCARAMLDPVDVSTDFKFWASSTLVSVILYRILLSAAARNNSWRRTCAGLACSLACTAAVVLVYRWSEASAAAALRSATMVVTTQINYAVPKPPRPMTRGYLAHAGQAFNVLVSGSKQTIVCIGGISMAFDTEALAAYVSGPAGSTAGIDTSHLSDRCR